MHAKCNQPSVTCFVYIYTVCNIIQKNKRGHNLTTLETQFAPPSPTYLILYAFEMINVYGSIKKSEPPLRKGKLPFIMVPLTTLKALTNKQNRLKKAKLQASPSLDQVKKITHLESSTDFSKERKLFQILVLPKAVFSPLSFLPFTLMIAHQKIKTMFHF